MAAAGELPIDPPEQQIAIVGAGLVGCMTALLLARREDNGRRYNIHLYEKRSDYRRDTDEDDTSQCVGIKGPSSTSRGA